MKMETADLSVQVTNQLQNVPSVGRGVTDVNQYRQFPVPAKVGKFRLVQQHGSVGFCAGVFHKELNVREHFPHCLIVFQGRLDSPLLFLRKNHPVVQMIDHGFRMQDVRKLFRQPQMIHAFFPCLAPFGFGMLHAPYRLMEKQRSLSKQIQVLLQVLFKFRKIKHHQKFESQIFTEFLPVNPAFLELCPGQHAGINVNIHPVSLFLAGKEKGQGSVSFRSRTCEHRSGQAFSTASRQAAT